MACADDTEVIIPHNMWHKNSTLRRSSGVNLGSPIPQSSSTNKRINCTVANDQISAEIIGAQEKRNPRPEGEEHAIQTVTLLPVSG